MCSTLVHVCQVTSVVFNSLQPSGVQPARLLYPWNSPGKNTGAGCHFLLQSILLTQGSNQSLLHLLHWQADSLSLLLLLLSRSVVSNSVRPHRRQPTRLPRPWDSPGKNTGVGCCFLLQCMKVKSQSEVAQSCLTLSDPMDCSLPGSSVRGIFQARVLEWAAIAFSALSLSHP